MYFVAVHVTYVFVNILLWLLYTWVYYCIVISLLLHMYVIRIYIFIGIYHKWLFCITQAWNFDAALQDFKCSLKMQVDLFDVIRCICSNVSVFFTLFFHRRLLPRDTYFHYCHGIIVSFIYIFMDSIPSCSKEMLFVVYSFHMLSRYVMFLSCDLRVYHL